MAKKVEKHEFQSEAKQVLELMIHSVYSNPDIFLRELISNASDALDKLRIESLSNQEISDMAKNGRIDIVIDKEKNILSVSDNGIGMSKEELMSYLGTIARSGTKEFMEAVQKAKSDSGSDLIGQFGVGFYSSFMVADKVTVETRKAGDEKTYIWESEGDGSYTIADGNRESNGTTITLQLKKSEENKESEEKDYLSRWTIQSIVKQYSDFVSYPIYLKDVSEKKGKDKKEEPLNSMKALWTRSKDDVTEDEYKEFYRHITHDWEDPLDRIQYKAEGVTEFNALLYIPSRPPMDLFFQNAKHGIQLYIRRVFIMSDCKDLMPEYLRFVKGVVDSENLSLNVSREILQQDRTTAVIKKSLTHKILDALKKMKTEDAEKYDKFWKNFGVVLKEGLISDFKNKELIMDLCLFDSSKGGQTTLESYISNMQNEQKKIYYITGASSEQLAKSPKLEAFKGRGIEVLLLGDTVDEIWVNNMPKFKDYDFLSIAAEDVDLPDSSTEEENKGKEKIEKSGFVDKIKKALSDSVEDVKLSTRLVDSPACYVQKGEAISPHMRNFFKSMGQEVPEEKRILELNPNHSLVKQAVEYSEKDDSNMKDWGEIFLALASIADGEPVANGKEFTDLLSKMIK